jgi:methyltransferase (TIGR00027 family)
MDSWKTKYVFPAMGMIPIDRSGGEKSASALDTAATVLRRGELFGIEFPETNVVHVEIDFETQALADVLADAGCEVGGLTFFVWEGVAMYLTRAAVTSTLAAVHALSGDGSQIAHDMWYLVDEPSPLGSARRAAPAALSLIGEAVSFGMHPEDYEALLARHGFAVVDLALASELQARYAPQVQAALDDSMYVVTAERTAH